MAALVLLAGCGQVQIQGGTLRKDPNAKLISLSPSTTEIVELTQMNQRLIGRTDADNGQVVSKVPVVVRNTKPDYEAITAAKPDIILYDSTIFSDLDTEKLKSTGAELFDFKAKNFKEFEDSLWKLTSRIGGEAWVSEYIDRIYIAREKYQGGMEGGEVKVMALMGGSGEYMAVGRQSILAEIMSFAGGTPVGPDSDKFTTMGAEQIVASAPEIIFTPGQADQILSDPRLQSVPAVKGRRVYDVNANYLLRTGQRVHDLIGAMGDQILNYKTAKNK